MPVDVVKRQKDTRIARQVHCRRDQLYRLAAVGVKIVVVKESHVRTIY